MITRPSLLFTKRNPYLFCGATEKWNPKATTAGEITKAMEEITQDFYDVNPMHQTNPDEPRKVFSTKSIREMQSDYALSIPEHTEGINHLMDNSQATRRNIYVLKSTNEKASKAQGLYQERLRQELSSDCK